MDDMVFASTLIYYNTHRQTHAEHTRTDILAHTYKCILAPSVMCTQQVPVLYCMSNFLIKIFTL